MDVDPRQLRRKRKQEQVREEILAASRRVILQKGLSGFTLSAVARELRLTKAALYHYFASKDALVFELVYQALEHHATAVGDAIDQTDSGAAALEALIRTAAAFYASRKDELRMAYMVPQVGAGGWLAIDPDQLVKIRPFNERIYGAVDAKVRADQAAGRIGSHINGRRLAFVAHTSVMGLLMVEGMIEVADSAPLIHGHEAMVDKVVNSFCGRLAPL